MRILLMGGTGLISTPMTLDLRERGHDITVCNRGKRAPELPTGVRQILADRTDHTAFEMAMRALEPFDVVIDMICYKPADAESLSRAFAGRTAHMIVCSTIDVFAKPASHYPITEQEPHRPPPWDYAENKALLEAILRQAHQRGDFPVTILRPAHTYNDGGALLHSLGGKTTYLDRLRKGKPIVVHGDGSSLWASCRAEDVARAFVEAAGSSVTFGKSYNVTGEEWMPWNRIHETVAAALDAPAPTLVHIPTDLLARVARRAFISQVNFQFNNTFDNAAARQDLNFRCTIPFAAGARRTVNWLAAHGRIENSDEDPYDDRILAAWERRSKSMAHVLQGINSYGLSRQLGQSERVSAG